MAKKNISQNIVLALPGVVVILLAAGALTYGANKAVAEATKPKPAIVKTVTVTKTDDTNSDAAAGSAASDSANKAAATTTTPVAAPAPAATTPTATTNSFVYLRPTASTSGTALKGLQAGTTVEYVTKTTGLWQKVTVDGVSGYVYKKWLTY